MTKLSSPDRKLTGVLHGLSWPVRIAIVFMAVVVGSLVISYAMYREWPWSTYPSTLKACGRDFEKLGPPETREHIEAGHAKLVRVGDMPGWFNQGDLWASEGMPAFAGNCRVVMYVHGDHDQFQRYDLVGGP
jgi:hypothetical protein